MNVLLVPQKTPYLKAGGDVFVFPKQDDPEVERAQLKLASMMVNPRVQALFNLAKRIFTNSRRCRNYH